MMKYRWLNKSFFDCFIKKFKGFLFFV